MNRWWTDVLWCLLSMSAGGGLMLAGYLVLHHVIHGTW